METQEFEHAHDLFFRVSMQNKEIALGVVRCSLETEVLNDIDFSSFEIEKDTWVDTVFSEHYADILYSACLKSEPAKIFFLFEHRSKTDPRVSRQILRYQNQIWDELEQQNVSYLPKLPVVIPIIIYHGKKRWDVVNSTKPLFAIIKGTERFIPDFESVIVDLNVLDIEKCRYSEELRAFLLALKYSRDPQVFLVLPSIIRPFSDLGKLENQYLAEVLLYLGSTIPKDKRKEFLEIIKREHSDGVAIMKTIADSFREEGREEGKMEGKMEDKFEIGRKMLKKGMSIELIMELTELSREQIEHLQKESTKT